MAEGRWKVLIMAGMESVATFAVHAPSKAAARHRLGELSCFKDFCNSCDAHVTEIIVLSPDIPSECRIEGRL